MVSNNYIEITDPIVSIVKLCIQISLAVGVIVVIAYCGVINYYPSGLTIGDSFFFVASSLAFAITYTVLVLGLFAAAVTLSPILRMVYSIVIWFINCKLKYQGKSSISSKINFPELKWDSLPMVFAGLLMLSIVAIASRLGSEVFTIVISILVISFFWGLFNTKPIMKEYDEKKAKKIKLIVVLMIYIAPFIIIETKSSFLNQAMKLIGVRIESSTVQISKKYKEFLKINGYGADQLVNNGDGIYKNVTVLFRGIGTDIVVDIDGYNIAIPNKEIIIGK